MTEETMVEKRVKMTDINDIQQTEAFKYFFEICKIPHGSENTGKISEYIVNFAKEKNLRYVSDEAGNVVIFKPASKGYENASPVILQGHIDMVCVKTPESTKDLEKEAVEPFIADGFVMAKDTSLGGDDGIAVSYMLALLESENLSHPALECVFTVDEEIGLIGANKLDTSILKGKTLINLDSEEEGIFTISCAGGATVTCDFFVSKAITTAYVADIYLSGFTGGHSGSDIIFGRQNGIVAMGRILLMLSKKVKYNLVYLEGGDKDNAIPTWSRAGIAFYDANDEKKIRDIVNKAFADIKNESEKTDKKMSVDVSFMSENNEVSVMTNKDTAAVVTAINAIPNGVIKMSSEVKDFVVTSLNLGVMMCGDGAVSLVYSVRSSVSTEKEYLINRLEAITSCLDGRISVKGEYPGWKYNENSKIKKVFKKCYKNQTGKDALVLGIHAGLECGIFVEKINDLDAISIGPDMLNVHTVNEKLSVESALRTYELIKSVLKELKSE